MNKSLFVISDLHLGGAEGFQMCSAAGRVRLADFLSYVAAQKRDDNEIHLVINGDIVDFLAEEEFSSFTNDDDKAVTKLQSIMSGTPEVWCSLRRLVASGVRLTMMLGNHDVELSFPGPRRLLLETIGGKGVEFIYDNQAFVDGQVLIEHGNRYDKWNVVAHDAIRAIRSAMSRRERPIEYLGPPGSQLVKQVMNPIKKQFPFVDLLKPENSGMLPILAVLDPAAMQNVPRLADLAAKSTNASYDVNGIPLDRQNIAAGSVPLKARDEMLELAMQFAGMGDVQNISAIGTAMNFWDRLKAAVSDKAKQVQLDMLIAALRAFSNKHRQSFDVCEEDALYLTPANAAAANGFRVVIYGHTHLVKRVNLSTPGALYLNTGTWADLMKVPEAILGHDQTEARRQLSVFLDDIGNGRLDVWRHQVPTYARIDFLDGAIIGRDVYLFESPATITKVPDGPLALMSYAVEAQ